MASTFKSAGIQNVGTSLTTAYTVPSSTTSTVVGLSIANTNATTVVSVDVTVTKSATATYLIKNAPIPPGSSLIVVGVDQKLVLQTTDFIQVKSNLASSVDVFTSFVEFT